MKVYYNEIDPRACAWLRELMNAGVIPKGDVDERSIEAVQPDDVAGYDQCHFFAGIGGWAFAFELARFYGRAWSASCPCPPFSSAGSKKKCPSCGGAKPYPCPWRTGYFTCSECDHSWLADSRHLWPEVWRLAAVVRPPIIFGEQVASEDGRVWLAGVRGTMETVAYAVGAADMCAAGVAAPQIRQRLWWLAESEEHAERTRLRAPHQDHAERPEAGRGRSGDGEPVGRLASPSDAERRAISGSVKDVLDGDDGGRAQAHGEPGACGEVRGSARGVASTGCLGDERGLRSAEAPRTVGEDQSDGDKRERRGSDAGSGGIVGGLGESDGDRRDAGEPATAPARHGSPAGPDGDTGRMADAASGRLGIDGSAQGPGSRHADQRVQAGGLGHSPGAGLPGRRRRKAGTPRDGSGLLESQRSGPSSGMGIAAGAGLEERKQLGGIPPAEIRGADEGQEPERGGDAGGMGGAESDGRGQSPDRPSWPESIPGRPGFGFWDRYTIVPCLDGKARRFEPESFPLAHGIPGRVGLLRGYGNAIVPEEAAEFILAYLETKGVIYAK